MRAIRAFAIHGLAFRAKEFTGDSKVSPRSLIEAPDRHSIVGRHVPDFSGTVWRRRLAAALGPEACPGPVTLYYDARPHESKWSESTELERRVSVGWGLAHGFRFVLRTGEIAES